MNILEANSQAQAYCEVCRQFIHTVPHICFGVIGSLTTIEAADEITHLERERDELRVKVEAARKILEPMADCDPDIREWLGLPRFGDALHSSVTTGGE